MKVRDGCIFCDGKGCRGNVGAKYDWQLILGFDSKYFQDLRINPKCRGLPAAVTLPDIEGARKS